MSSDVREKYAVPAEKLRFRCEPVEPVPASDGSAVKTQQRAMASVEMSLEMRKGPYSLAHYNVLVTGPRSTGRTAKTLERVRRHAAEEACDIETRVCLHDHTSPRRAAVFFLPSETAHEIKKELRDLAMWALNKLRRQVVTLRSDRWEELSKAFEEQWRLTREKVVGLGFFMLADQDGSFHGLSPISPLDPRRPLSEEDLEILEQQEELKFDRERFMDDLQENRDAAMALVNETSELVNGMYERFMTERFEQEKIYVLARIRERAEELLKMAGGSADFLRCFEGIEKGLTAYGLKDEDDEPMVAAIKRAAEDEDETASILRLCNLVILDDRKDQKTAPVVHVEVPQYSRLFGRIGSQPTGQGLVRFDHTMIEGGEYLKAHGGYLVLDLDDLLTYGDMVTLFKLLQVIRTGRLTIESKAKFLDIDHLSDYGTRDFPVDVRVIAVCDRHLAQVLRYVLPEFDNLFRIDSEFDDEMPVEEAKTAYATFIGLCRCQEGLREFTPEAVARLIEYGVRRAGDQRKASTEFGIIKDVCTEADYWARKTDSDVIEPEHVQMAIDDRFDRSALWVRKYREFHDDSVLMQHDGETVGQVNALVVLGGHEEVAMGLPSRITCRTFAGDDGVVLVQREVDLSGPSSDTAVVTITGFLKARFGKEDEFSLTAQLSFEQCYGEVDGDSASLAEVIAIVSAITELPVDQRLTVTGSMNQLGEAQPIGGATLKIEGHYDNLVRAGLLKPGHGVVLPRRNLNNLMLKEQLVEDAGENGPYRVYAIDHVDQALEIFLRRPIEEIERIAGEKLAKKKGKAVRNARRIFRWMFRTRD